MTSFELGLLDMKMSLQTYGDPSFSDIPEFCRKSCLRPACIPITIIIIFVILVVLFPVINQGFRASGLNLWECDRDCRFTLVESIPNNLTYEPGSPVHISTYLAWKKLLRLANTSIDIASFYWTLRGSDVYVDPSDWQVKELGALVTNCSCLAYDLEKIFEVYWLMAERESVPRHWPLSVRTKFNASNPWEIKLNGSQSQVYFSSSPPTFCPKKRESDISAILKVIENAKEYVHIAVMDYDVAILYSKQRKYWPVIDDALRSAAYDRGVRVKLMCSKWHHTHRDMLIFLKSLTALNPALHSKNASIEVKLFEVPSFSKKQSAIPFARVNHNKYMVTDNTAYIGTSNWAGDYFIRTAGVGLVISQSGKSSKGSQPIVDQLESVFQRDWNSKYAHPLLHYEIKNQIVDLFRQNSNSNYKKNFNYIPPDHKMRFRGSRGRRHKNVRHRKNH